jgi:hypothetical protein
MLTTELKLNIADLRDRMPAVLSPADRLLALIRDERGLSVAGFRKMITLYC